MDVNITMR